MENLNGTGNIVYKSSQVCAYADDVVLIARSEAILKEMISELIYEGKKMGLEVNANKTKYMRTTKNPARNGTNDIQVEDMIFSGVQNFTYLGVDVNYNNKVSHEIKKRIMAGNRAYFANIKLITSRSISRATKMKIYKSLIRTVVTYGSETWNLSASDANKLRIFERKVIRKIYGGISADGITWRRRTNAEIDELLNKEDIVRYIKSQRLRWIGHIERMASHRTPNSIYKAAMEGRRRKGRPRNRWKDEVVEDLRKMSVLTWRRKANDRMVWKGIVKEAKAHPEL